MLSHWHLVPITELPSVYLKHNLADFIGLDIINFVADEFLVWNGRPIAANVDILWRVRFSLINLKLLLLKWTKFRN